MAADDKLFISRNRLSFSLNIINMVIQMKSSRVGNPRKYNNGNFLFYGLIIYTILFYTQIAARYTFLMPFRLELLVGAFLLFNILIKHIKGEINVTNNNMTKSILFFFAIIIVGIPFAYFKSQAIEIAIRIFKFFAIYLMIIAAINDEKKLRIFIYVYVSCIALLFIEPFFNYLYGSGTYYSQGVTRLRGVTGLFSHPNSLGGITAANLPFYYFLVGTQKSIISKILLLALMIIAVIVIVLTNSRTALVALISFAAFVWLKSKAKILSLILILISLLIIWHFTPPETKNRYMTIGEATSIVSGAEHGRIEGVSSMAHRWLLIKISLEIFTEHPILGVGVGCFQPMNGQRNNIWLPTHCLYTEILSETGIMGLLAFSMVIFSILKNFNNTAKLLQMTNKNFLFISNMLSALSIFLTLRFIVGFFGNDLYTNYWWIAGGLSVVMLNITKNKCDISD